MSEKVSGLVLVIQELRTSLVSLCEGEREVKDKANTLLSLLSEIDECYDGLGSLASLFVISHPLVRSGVMQDGVDVACMEAWKGVDRLASIPEEALGFDHSQHSRIKYPVSAASSWNILLIEYFKFFKDIDVQHEQLYEDFVALGDFPEEKDIGLFMKFMHRLTNLESEPLCKVKWLAQVLVFGCRTTLG